MALAFGVALMLGVTAVLFEATSDAIVIAGCLGLLVVLVPGTTKRIVLCGLCGFVFGFGITTIRSNADVHDTVAPPQSPVVGRLVSDPRLVARGSIVTMEWSYDGLQSAETVLFFSGVEGVARGDLVEADGEWFDPTGELFFADSVKLIERAGTVDRMRTSIRETVSQRVLDRVPGSSGSLALGLSIGDDSGLTIRERQDVRASGLSHITAVSGSNVVLVIVAVAFVLRAMNRTSWPWFAAQFAGILFYVWIVGTEPPIVRAAIMASLILVAALIGRPTHLFTLLALAGAAMCLHDPEVLTSLGFQLSFLSMIGLGLAGDVIARTRGQGRKVVAALLSPAAAALLTAPLIAARFGTLSVGTVPANVAVAPLIGPSTILAGLVALVPTGFISGDILGSILWVFALVILKVASIVGGSSFAVLTFTPLSRTQTVGVYLLIALALAPLVPEVRVTGFRIRRWIASAPARAGVALSAGSVMVAAVLLSID